MLKRKTGKRLSVALHTLDYRHTVVGISQVKVGELFTRGYQDKISKIDKAKVDDNEDLLKLQNSQLTVIGVGNYSVSLNIIKHLSAQLINTFQALSTA